MEKFTEEFKQACVDEWVNELCGEISKEMFCRNRGISPRSLNRWLETFDPTEEEDDVETNIALEKGKHYRVKSFRGTFHEGSIIELVGCTEDVWCAFDFDLFKLIDGDSDILCPAGNGEGAYEYIDNIEEIEDVEEGDDETPLNITFVYTGESITLFRGNDSVAIDRSFPDFDTVVALLVDGELEDAWEAANVKFTLDKYSHGSITVEDGRVFYKNFEVNGKMTDKLVTMLENREEGVATFCNFFENLMKVQDKRVVEELYDFLRHNDIVLNDDGSFTGWKAVTSEFKDKHTRQIDNSVGSVVEMPRHLVDDNKDRTCSVGLHVGSKEYVGSFGNCSDRFVAVKVWPEDVVSVPTDYNGQKLRCCRYTVLEDITDSFRD